METITSKATKATTEKKSSRTFEIRCYKKKELAAALGFSNSRAFDYALKGIDDPEKVQKRGWYYTPLQVEAIIKHVGFDRIQNN